jgi:nucleotide-binding universal stress UspA family protein
MTRKIDHIIAATDFSELGNAAVAQAGLLAKQLGAKVTLAHVFDPMPLGPAAGYPTAIFTAVPEVASLRREVDKHLERVADKALQGVEVSARLRLEHNSASLALCNLAEETAADLVVVGTQGRTGVSRLLIGSVAEVTLRHAPCGVLAVRGAAGLPKRLLVATDFSPASTPALDSAALLAKALDAKVTVLHVYVAPPPIWGERQRELQDVDRELRDTLRDRHTGLLEQPAELALMRSDNAALAISDYAKEHDIDLVVVATHGRTGIKRVVVGSVAEVTTRHAPCSVCTAR